MQLPKTLLKKGFNQAISLRIGDHEIFKRLQPEVFPKPGAHFIDSQVVHLGGVPMREKILKEAGLIRGEADRRLVCYCIEARQLRRLRALTAAL